MGSLKKKFTLWVFSEKELVFFFSEKGCPRPLHREDAHIRFIKGNKRVCKLSYYNHGSAKVATKTSQRKDSSSFLEKNIIEV